MALAPGTRLGPYEILAPLGAGGMGEVYKARDTRLDRTVAIKVLPEHLSATPELRVRFEREARAVSSLNHPHICTLFDVGREGDVDFLVMEHLEGEPLAQRLERGPLPPTDVMRYAIEIADALDKAHRQGMVHRDLKPGNVMLTKGGAKLLDFGLARVEVPPAPGSGARSGPAMLTQTPTMSRPLTAAGMIVGTFQYMAPEQLEGAEADARSDIWAFGATLYEMATAQRAFSGHSQASLIASILKEQPRPIAELQPMSPPGLDRVVQRCLAKDPDERWQSARDMAHELRWITEAGSKAGVPAPVAARRRLGLKLTGAIALVSTLGMIGFAIAFVLRAPKQPEVVRFEVRPPSTVQFQDAPRISPDGRYLAYSANDSTGTARIWVRTLAALTDQMLQGSEGINQRPFWSTDSRYLGFFAGGKLKKIEVSGGPAVTICDAQTGSDGSWSRTGVILYDGQANDPIMRVSASGGTAAPAFLPDTAHHESVGWPWFLPDGRNYVYMDITSRHLRLRRLDTKESKDLVAADSRAEYTSPGYLLFTRGGTLVAQRFDARSLKLQGEAFPVAEPIRTQPNGGADFSTSETGTLVYASGGLQNSRLVWVDRSGRELSVVPTPDLPNAMNPALSPDGRRVAVRVLDPQARTRDLWLIDLTRGVTSRFTFDPRNENNPTWSPDGGRIVYSTDATDAPGLRIRNASGEGEAEQLLKSGDSPISTDWSRDGRFVIYELGPSASKNEIWAIPTEGDRKPFAFMRGSFNYYQGMLSPDGRWLAYTSDESGRPEVFVQSFPGHGGKWQISTAGGLDPHWRSDGKELLFLSADQKLMSVTVRGTAGFEADVPQPLFTARTMSPGLGPHTHYAVSADGQRFLIAAPLAGVSLSGNTVVLNWTADARRR